MSLAYKISAFNRRRKYQIFLKKIKPQKRESILDVGFNNIEYSENDNYLEKNYPYPEKISALGLGSGKEFARRYPLVKTYTYAGDEFPFPKNKFNIVWSNAVLEHVGNTEKQIEFLKEVRRTGKRAFITTPNKNFPFEIHTRVPLLHFLPKNIFDAYLRLIGKSWATGDYMNLLTEKKLRYILRKANIKNYRIIKNKLLSFTLDFIIIS